MSSFTFTATLQVGPKGKRTNLPDLKVSANGLTAAGDQWGENLILRLGSHFGLYALLDPNAPIGKFKVKPTLPKGVLPGTVRAATTKMRGGSVSGNFGEVVTLLYLQSRLPAGQELEQCRLQIGNSSVPDLLVKAPDFLKSAAGSLPYPLPVECKSSAENLGSGFSEALSQLSSYWQAFTPQDPRYGYGLVSNLHYPTQRLRLTLIVPILAKRQDFRKIEDQKAQANQPLVQADFRGCFDGF